MPKEKKVESLSARKAQINSEERYIADTFLAQRYGVHRTTIWRWAREGKFPKPVKLPSGTARWRASDIVKWEDAA